MRERMPAGKAFESEHGLLEAPLVKGIFEIKKWTSLFRDRASGLDFF